MKVILKDVRGAFLNLWEPKKFGDTGEARCNGSFLMDPKTPAGAANIKALQDAMVAVAKEKWGEKAAEVFKSLKAKGNLCLQDGASKSEYDGFDGMMFVSAGNKARPAVVNKNKAPLTEKDGVAYSGAYYNVSIDVWPQDNKYGRRINAKLLAVQFYRDGDAFSGGEGYADTDFEDEDGSGGGNDAFGDEPTDDFFG